MKILVVDDEPDVVELITLTFNLQWQESEVIAATDGESALKLLEEESPDVVVLDVGLPGMSGFDVCHRLRERSDVPILMLTIRGKLMDRLKGLDLGADDYIVKPFEPLELVARTQAVLRRSRLLPVATSDRIVVDDNLTIDLGDSSIISGDRSVKLTPIECRLLSHLVYNAGRVMPYRALVARVWGAEGRNDMLLLKVHIARLREKLGDDARSPRYITTDRGLGYRFTRISSQPRAVGQEA
jgi:DNA-binding response OmpR family regulator